MPFTAPLEPCWQRCWRQRSPRLNWRRCVAEESSSSLKRRVLDIMPEPDVGQHAGGTATEAAAPDAQHSRPTQAAADVEDSEAATQCAACKELIGRDRRKVIALSRHYHRECFKCTRC